jgi:hypothetical protein
MATNYYRLIFDLVSYKEELYRITAPKFQPLIAELKKFEIIPDIDNENLPSNKSLAAALNYKLPRMGLLIRDLHKRLIEDFMCKPLKIKDVVHVIHIQFSSRELNQMDKKVRLQFEKESTWVELELPRTPSIGDEIRLDFMTELEHFYHGHVHRIEHEIRGTRQTIYLEVHPLYNYYSKWLSMKDDYERWMKK